MQNDLDITYLVEKFFLDNGKQVSSNRQMAQHWVDSLQEYDIDIIKTALEDIGRSEDFFPKLKKVVSHIKRLMPDVSHLGEKCNKCNGDGLTFGIVALTSKGSVRISSYDHASNIGSDSYYFTDSVIGRCDCKNGLEYSQTKNPVMRKIAQPPLFLVDSAKSKGLPVCLEARCVAISLSKNRKVVNEQ
tara:strand:+ start:235 stop:798 length:564 start_codon:yes stop_codon:yes gene_type:complete